MASLLPVTCDLKKVTVTPPEPLLSNGSAKKHVSTKAAIAQQQMDTIIMGRGVFYVVRAKTL
jgi:hypothetical protein